MDLTYPGICWVCRSVQPQSRAGLINYNTSHSIVWEHLLEQTLNALCLQTTSITKSSAESPNRKRGDQNWRTKFGTLFITDISCCLKGHTNKLKYVTVSFTKTTHLHSEIIVAVSPEILHTWNAMTSLPFCKFVFMILRCYGLQWFWPTNSVPNFFSYPST